MNITCRIITSCKLTPIICISHNFLILQSFYVKRVVICANKSLFLYEYNKELSKCKLNSIVLVCLEPVEYENTKPHKCLLFLIYCFLLYVLHRKFTIITQTSTTPTLNAVCTFGALPLVVDRRESSSIGKL